MTISFTDGQVLTAAGLNALSAQTNNFAGGTVPGATTFANALSIGASGYIGASGSRAWSGGSLSTNPVITQQLTWSGSNGTAGPTAFNFIQATDITNAGVGAGNSGTALQIGLTTGTSAKIGQCNAVDIGMQLSSTSGNTIARGVYGVYTGQRTTAYATANDNGTAIAPWSQIFGHNTIAALYTGATYWAQLIGVELDIMIQTGASATDKIGYQIVQLAGDATHGSRDDVALTITNQYGPGGGAGWNTGFSFGRQGGHFPMAVGGTMITAIQGQSSSMTVAKGIDWAGVTFTGNQWSSPGLNFNSVGNITTSLLISQAPTHVNQFVASGNSTGNAPQFYAQGSDADISLNASTKGVGSYAVYNNNFGNIMVAMVPVASSDRYVALSPGTSARPAQLWMRGNNDNILLGGNSGTGGATLLTTDTTGYIMIPNTAGAPTGVPTNNAAGTALAYDKTNNKLYAYNGGWKASGVFA